MNDVKKDMCIWYLDTFREIYNDFCELEESQDLSWFQLCSVKNDEQFDEYYDGCMSNELIKKWISGIDKIPEKHRGMIGYISVHFNDIFKLYFYGMHDHALIELWTKIEYIVNSKYVGKQYKYVYDEKTERKIKVKIGILEKTINSFNSDMEMPDGIKLSDKMTDLYKIRNDIVHENQSVLESLNNEGNTINVERIPMDHNYDVVEYIYYGFLSIFLINFFAKKTS